jgi:hypothetical protein
MILKNLLKEPKSRDATLTWLAKVCQANKSRAQIQVGVP